MNNSKESDIDGLEWVVLDKMPGFYEATIKEGRDKCPECGRLMTEISSKDVDYLEKECHIIVFNGCDNEHSDFHYVIVDKYSHE